MDLLLKYSKNKLRSFELHPSTYYYQPCGESAENLLLMREIDKLYTKYPFYGSRRLAVNLATECQPIKVKKISRLMKLMGIEAIYPKPNLSKPDLEPLVSSYNSHNIN